MLLVLLDPTTNSFGGVMLRTITVKLSSPACTFATIVVTAGPEDRFTPDDLPEAFSILNPHMFNAIARTLNGAHGHASTTQQGEAALYYADILISATANVIKE